MHIFVIFFLELVQNAFFINIEKQIEKKNMEKSFIVFEGAPFKLFEHTMIYFHKKFYFFCNIHEK